MSATAILISLLFGMVLISYVLFKLLLKERKELKKIEKNLETTKEILKKERENEEDKKKLHTGDSSTDFTNSLNLLRKHANSK